jgi:hypothetical protein
MDRIIGVKIYDYERDFIDLFAQWRDLGITAAFVGEKLISKNGFRDLAEQNGLMLFCILPVFHNPEMLEKNPLLYAITGHGWRAQEEWLRFVCPSRHEYRRDRIELIKRLIQEYQPTGISLDFIRHYIYWEKISGYDQVDPLSAGCFCTTCLEGFQSIIDQSIPERQTQISQKAKWILTNYSASGWNGSVSE